MSDFTETISFPGTGIYDLIHKKSQPFRNLNQNKIQILTSLHVKNHFNIIIPSVAKNTHRQLSELSDHVWSYVLYVKPDMRYCASKLNLVQLQHVANAGTSASMSSHVLSWRYLAIVAEDNFDTRDGFFIGTHLSSCMIRASSSYIETYSPKPKCHQLAKRSLAEVFVLRVLPWKYFSKNLVLLLILLNSGLLCSVFTCHT
jgi:hypothetical protein